MLIFLVSDHDMAKNAQIIGVQAGPLLNLRDSADGGQHALISLLSTAGKPANGIICFRHENGPKDYLSRA